MLLAQIRRQCNVRNVPVTRVAECVRRGRMLSRVLLRTAAVFCCLCAINTHAADTASTASDAGIAAVSDGGDSPDSDSGTSDFYKGQPDANAKPGTMIRVEDMDNAHLPTSVGRGIRVLYVATNK